MQQVTAPGFQAIGLAPAGASLPLPAIDVNLRLISPVSSAVGSPRLHYNLVVAATTLPMAGFVVIILCLIVQIVAWCFREDRIDDPSGIQPPDQAVSLSMSELASLLNQLKPTGGNGPSGMEAASAEPSGPSTSDCHLPAPGENWTIKRPGVQINPPVPMKLYIFVNASMTGRAETPGVALFFPVISFRGITGGLPITIIGLISTIFVRSVVPPVSSGVVPVGDPPAQAQPKFEFSPQQLIRLLRNYGKYFK